MLAIFLVLLSISFKLASIADALKKRNKLIEDERDRIIAESKQANSTKIVRG